MREKRKNLICFILVLIAIVSLVSFGELHLLIEEGEWIRWNGLRRASKFFLDGSCDIHSSWLRTLLYYLAEHYLPSIGPMVIYLFCIAATLGTLYQTAIFKNNNQQEKAQEILLLFGTLIISGISLTNIPVETLAFFMGEILLLEKYTRIRKGKYLAPIVVLTTLQLQFDAGMWPVMILTMVPYILDYTPFSAVGITYGKYKKMPVVLTLITSFFAGYINPYSEKSVAYRYFPFAEGYTPSALLSMEYVKYFPVAVAIIITLAIFAKVLKDESVIPIRYAYLLLGFIICILSDVSYVCFFLCMAAVVAAYVFRISESSSEGWKIVKTFGMTVLVCFALTIPMLEAAFFS